MPGEVRALHPYTGCVETEFVVEEVVAGSWFRIGVLPAN